MLSSKLIKNTSKRSQPHQSTKSCSSSNTMDSFLDKMPESDQDYLDTLLARSFFSGNVSFNFIENEHFKKWMKIMRPSYVLPDRKKLSSKLLDKEFELVQTLTKAEIESSSSMTLISDGWTDINGTPIVNLLLATPRPIFYNSVNTGENAHTAEYISKILEEAITANGKKKISSIITDNARNMKKAWTILQKNFPICSV